MKGDSHKNPHVQVRNAHRREKAAYVKEMADDRRASVYKTDPALFTGDEVVRPKRTPKRGTPEREELERRIIEMSVAGKTQLEIATELDTYTAFIYRVMKAHRRR